MERFWIFARLVCIFRGHVDEVIGMSTGHPTVQCQRCCKVWND
jgi:hypothetical protein